MLVHSSTTILLHPNPFRKHQLDNVTESHRHEGILEAIKQALHDYIQDAAQSDDITIVIAKKRQERET